MSSCCDLLMQFSVQKFNWNELETFSLLSFFFVETIEQLIAFGCGFGST